MRSPLLVAGLFCLSACATSFQTPRNIADLQTESYQAQRQPMSGRSAELSYSTAAYQNAGRCADMDLVDAPVDVRIATRSAQTDVPLLSPGDLIRIEIARGEGFSGDYVIDANGYIQFPHIGLIPAAGFALETVEHSVARLLVEGELFHPSFAQVSVSVLQWAPIQVHVSGAVFFSGDKILNQQSSDDVRQERIAAAGDHSVSRTLTAALRSATGIRPDADIRNVVLIRNGQRRIFDMSGAINGGLLEDPLLVAGDRIHIPSRGCFQIALARPSRITMPGIRVFMSNLTRPAASNASSAIGRESTSLPYGTRLLQGLVSANCVGGIQATSADRWAVLVSRNPITGESEVISRHIERLVRRADRDDFNPVLLPGDAIACYDSHVTNVRDVASALSGVASPITKALIPGTF
ncbi:MAG: polysaccharide biosynthesis/export family protein [Pseudomonadota bacterium]